MKNITFKSNFGRFAYTITCEVGEEVNEATTALCLQGLANVGFRGVASGVEKALVAAKLMTKDDKRDAVAYSDEAGITVMESAQKKLDEIAKKDGLPHMSFEVTGEHVFGESEASRKMATALLNQIKAMPDAQRAGMELVLGFAPEDSEEAKITKCHAFISGMKAPKKEKAKAEATVTKVEEEVSPEASDESAE